MILRNDSLSGDSARVQDSCIIFSNIVIPITSGNYFTCYSAVITGGLDSKMIVWDFSKGRPFLVVDFGNNSFSILFLLTYFEIYHSSMVQCQMQCPVYVPYLSLIKV